MMLRNETWMVALEALWANKIRAFLTTLGVIIGSACIVLVVTVAMSGRRYVISQIEGRRLEPGLCASGPRSESLRDAAG
jgi:hypothetical protein